MASNPLILNDLFQGLEPVKTVAKHNGNPMMDVGEEFNCSVSEVGIPGPRDIASAPF